MLAAISKLILKLFGWKEAGDFPEGDKFVVLVVPHTSMFDFVWGRVYYYSIKKSVKFMIKDKYFFFPLGIFLRAIGAIPVVLNRKVGMVEQMVAEFN
ncbi:MAG: glycerol acyltransferase, partial [Bacteroidales bacterium]|nr:glycerol acyltransferase [Bacteroidales bacterium]